VSQIAVFRRACSISSRPLETHFWWPDLPGDMREVFRVLKPGGTLILIAEIYKGANTIAAKLAEKIRLSNGP